MREDQRKRKNMKRKKRWRKMKRRRKRKRRKRKIISKLYCEDSYTESLCCDSAFAHKKEFYIFKFPKRFLEIS